MAAQLGLLLECAAEGIYGIDLEGNFTFLNRAAADMLGLVPEEVIGQNAHELVHHSHADGSPYSVGECPIFQAFRSGQGCRVDSEVLWRADGTSFPASYASFPLHRDGVVEGAVITFTDITQRRQSETALREANERLLEVATTDPLTGLPNRTLFSERLHQALAEAAREGHDVAVLFIDLDRFKDVNDTLGHHCGDDLLVEVSRRLVRSMRSTDTVVRLGGDEFAVLLSGVTTAELAVAAAERVLDCFRASFESEGLKFFVSASVGGALLPQDSSSAAELLQHADLAMYRAKAAGGARFEIYQPLMTAFTLSRLQLEGELHRALGGRQFFLRYHPQIDLRTGEVVAVEVLLRWNHPDHGEVAPLEFIPVAEDTGLIIPIGNWVLEEACRQATVWGTQLAALPPLRIAVNVVAYQVSDPDFVEFVARTLKDLKISPSALELEITESTLISESGLAITALHRLRSLGVTLAIDDFGTGYSSLAYLRRFPVDRLKLDRSFISGLGVEDEQTNDSDRALVAATVQLAHALKLGAVAEGVETHEQVELLVDLGCDLGQGFLWTAPLRGDEFRDWLIQRNAMRGV